MKLKRAYEIYQLARASKYVANGALNQAIKAYGDAMSAAGTTAVARGKHHTKLAALLAYKNSKIHARQDKRDEQEERFASGAL
jgi:hypothetical protein